MAKVEYDEQLTSSEILSSDIASLGFDVMCTAVNSANKITIAKFKVDIPSANFF